MDQTTSLLTADKVVKSFPLPAGGHQTVLEEVSVNIVNSEIVALLVVAARAKARCCASLPAWSSRSAAAF